MLHALANKLNHYIALPKPLQRGDAAWRGRRLRNNLCRTKACEALTKPHRGYTAARKMRLSPLQPIQLRRLRCSEPY